MQLHTDARCNSISGTHTELCQTCLCVRCTKMHKCKHFRVSPALEIPQQGRLVRDSISGDPCRRFHILVKGPLLEFPCQWPLAGYFTCGAPCWKFHMRGLLLEIPHVVLLVGDSISGALVRDSILRATCWRFHIRGPLVGYSTSGARCWRFVISGPLLEVPLHVPLVRDSISGAPCWRFLSGAPCWRFDIRAPCWRLLISTPCWRFHIPSLEILYQWHFVGDSTTWFLCWRFHIRGPC